MASERIGDIVSAYQSAAMERDDYWRAMQQRHLELREYCGLIERARLQRVEIDGSELRLVLENGLRIRWKPEDVRTAPNILINHGEYESGELSLLEHFA